MNSKHTAPPQQDVQATEPDAIPSNEVKETPDDNTAAGTEVAATENKEEAGAEEAAVNKEAGMAQLIFPPLLMNLIAYSIVVGILKLGTTVFSLTDQFLVYPVFFVNIALSCLPLYFWYARFPITDNCQTLWTKLIFRIALVTATALGIYMSVLTVTPSYSVIILGIKLFLFFIVPNLGISLALIDHFEKIHKLKPE
ncbi:hypothetical protein [Macrococcus carouselicus]|uniref:Uncharacterized protein n=1 Tax=Macrococcus carouselicus TaxID=69969 RepID=A0A9Q8CJV6_9STAP|nr:hypothetical protein [Macrococcus carouselicus]TDL94367.1 hypothetical protein ERX40_10845 [Macrococcus carouselicus]